MATQFIQLGPFFHQGELCGAAKIEHYEAGTNTLKNIWANAAQTVVLANPFVSDANGIFNFFGDGVYKFVIKKANGEVLHTLDDWKVQDIQQDPISVGAPVPTASAMTLGTAALAHWTGSVNVATMTGSSPFYWAIADGNFTLINSGNLLLPDSRNRKVLQGDTLFFIRESAGVYRLSGHMQKEGGWTGRQAATYAATATLAVPTDGDVVQVSGTTNISAVASAAAGIRFRVMFTGTGLNIIHSANLGSPWGRDYRTIQNEIIEFQSFGSGAWAFYSVNGPKERVGVSLEWNSTTLPPGYLWENGQAVSRTTYSGLYAEIGTVFGAGDGSTTFNIGDCQGRMTLCVDGAANRVTSASTGGANADTMGGTGGAQTHSLSISEMAVHDHSNGFTGVGTASGGAASGSYGNQTNTGSTGGGGAHNNMPPWIAKQKIIRF